MPAREIHMPNSFSTASCAFKLLATVAGMLLVVGCKIHVSVPDDGAVLTESGSLYCGPGEFCEVDVSDTFFDESFVAEPTPGHIFTGWKIGHRTLCGTSRKPCALSTSWFSGFPSLLAFLNSDDEVYYLNPNFVPRDNAVEVSGYELSAGKQDAKLVLKFTLPSDEVLVLPYLLSGEKAGTSVVARFKGNVLEGITEELIDHGIGELAFNIAEFSGQTGELSISFSTEGEGPSKLLIIDGVQDPTI